MQQQNIIYTFIYKTECKIKLEIGRVRLLLFLSVAWEISEPSYQMLLLCSALWTIQGGEK